jgi:hypothetical protein
MATIKPVYSLIPDKPTVQHAFDATVPYPTTATTDIGTLHTEVESVGSVATINFTGIPTLNQTIAIISTDGTSKTYTAKAATDTAANEFESQTSAAHCASSLKDCLEATDGHFGKLTINKNGELLTLTQTSVGTTGDKTTTSTLANCTATNFADGVDGIEGKYDESAEAITALVAGYATDAAEAKKLEHARKVVLGYI